MTHQPALAISGGTAAEIADSVRDLIEAGVLAPRDALPPVRTLARELDVNRNTVVAAYGLLARSGVVVGQGRAGTRVASHAPVAQEGPVAREGRSAGVLRDVGTGNPAAELIPDLAPALQAAVGRPVLYGEPVIDRGLDAWARGWMALDVPAGFRLTVTSGAVDAVERLLAQALTRDDAVALEDPCFLASIHVTRLGGYRAVAVPVDDEGMTVDGLRAALAQGVRAVIGTPRAQNPTGVSLSARRAEQLRAVLAEHPYVLVIEDDYYSLLSRRPFHSMVGPGHRRWALVRSVSKFIGPDICLALVASDAETASPAGHDLGQPPAAAGRARAAGGRRDPRRHRTRRRALRRPQRGLRGAARPPRGRVRARGRAQSVGRPAGARPRGRCAARGAGVAGPHRRRVPPGCRRPPVMPPAPDRPRSRRRGRRVARRRHRRRRGDGGRP